MNEKMDQQVAGKPRIFIGSDHAGVLYKAGVRRSLESEGYTVIDLGADTTEPVDYPDVSAEVARKVVESEGSIGVLICGTGIGTAMTANKVLGIRAAVCNDLYTAEYAKRHNDANVITFGARVVSLDLGIQIVRKFLNSQFEGGRHTPRVEKIRKLDVSR